VLIFLNVANKILKYAIYLLQHGGKINATVMRAMMHGPDSVIADQPLHLPPSPDVPRPDQPLLPIMEGDLQLDHALHVQRVDREIVRRAEVLFGADAILNNATPDQLMQEVNIFFSLEINFATNLKLILLQQNLIFYIK
jgi:hypothetical protein